MTWNIEVWQDKAFRLKSDLIAYNWEYRKKICSKCTPEQQEKYRCHKVNRFKNGIQETHCRKLIQARTKKYKKRIEGFLNSHPLCNSN